jgi:hypothetical protein
MAKSTTIEAPTKIDPKLADYMARAKVARELRKAAPVTSLKGAIRIPQKEAIARFSKDSGGQDGTFHWMFGDREKSDFYADHGYEPVLHQGMHYHIDGDPMWKIPADIHQEDLDSIAAQSNRIRDAKRTASPDSAEVRGTTETKVTDGEGNVKMDTFTSPE